MLQISLKAARVNADLKQEEAANELGVTAKTLRNYENGATGIPGHVLKRAALLYEVPEDAIRLPQVNDATYDDEEFFLHDTTV